MSEDFPSRSHCPINYALESFGDKWTLLIIRDLMFKTKTSFNEFLSSNEKISTNILADRLRRLESLGIVSKEVSDENRSKLIYSLTRKGRDLLPIMMEITQWSGRYDPQTNAPEALLKRLEADKLGLIKDIEAGWEHK
ncbi:MAG TPA: transcriptional regulator [Pseudomonas sabulinigri]|uniref:HTH hxlR-type domain-containing protein n=1 Tax=marine sediment metagenome TaxID=412755 RepID=A0A0F9YU33_9ZZZZ|nr:transcriptional regulator [Halopseudomonas sabulinigri]HEC50360.1 transcriptional regulator [Halopseudomonas sabulinigri]